MERKAARARRRHSNVFWRHWLALAPVEPAPKQCRSALRFDPYLLADADADADAGEEEAEEVEEAGGRRQTQLGEFSVVLLFSSTGCAWKRRALSRTLPRRPVIGKTAHLGCKHLLCLGFALFSKHVGLWGEAVAT